MPVVRMRAAVAEVMEFLDEGLANGCCAFCHGGKDDDRHESGCLCTMLQAALDEPVSPTRRPVEDVAQELQGALFAYAGRAQQCGLLGDYNAATVVREEAIEHIANALRTDRDGSG